MMNADDDGSAADNKAVRPTKNADSEPKEGVGKKVSRGFAGCGLCCFKLKEQTQISALEFKITARQKKFGVDYLTLVERKASQPALKGCLKEALRDIATLQTQVNDHYDKIDEKQGEGATSTPTTEAAAGTKPKPNRDNSGDTENVPTKKKSTKKKKKPEGQDERFAIE
jgi:hypothetical protein